MQYRSVPRNGDQLSVLGFGCMRLPQRDGGIDEPRAIKQVRYAIDNGVNYIDTAWPYHGGASEPFVAKALADGYRDRVKLATKLPTWICNDRADMDHYLNAQLERLQTDRIDYYLLHTLNGGTWDRLRAARVLEFVEDAIADGRIINAGFSYHGLSDDFNRIVDAYSWVFCQIQYNYLDTEYQAGLEGLRYAASKDLAVIVMEPLRGGDLARPEQPPAVAELWDNAPTKRTPVDWALRWIWNHPEVTLLLSGMNEEAHIDQNIALAAECMPGALNQAELDLIDSVSRKYREIMQVHCTGCGYCMPCPSDVMIPTCFEELNKLHMYGGGEDVKFRYAFRTGGVLTNGQTGFASQCVNCGACIEQCPQSIPIPDRLADVTASFEDERLQQRVVAAREMFRAGAN